MNEPTKEITHSNSIKTQNAHKEHNFFSNKKTWYYVIGGIALTSIAIGLSQSNDTNVRPVSHD